MNALAPKIIDSHVHLDILHRIQPQRVEWMRDNEYVPISWAFGGRPNSADDLGKALNKHAEFIRDLNQDGYACFYLTGIHPRCIPSDLRPTHIEGLLSPFLEDPLCLGIGEIGLETGNSIEIDIFSSQIELRNIVSDKNKKIGIHTPRQNKNIITEQILSILDDFPGLEDISVIDHCTPHTISHVLAKGFHAGITLSPEKTSTHDMENIVQKHSSDLERIMCNTDSGGRFYEDLYRFSTLNDVSSTIRSQICCKTGFQFFVKSAVNVY